MIEYSDDSPRLIRLGVKTFNEPDSGCSLLVYSERKNQLYGLRDAFHKVAKCGTVVDADTILLLITEAIHPELTKYFAQTCKEDKVLYFSDFETISGKEETQKIVYNILRYRVENGKNTIVFSNWDVFTTGIFREELKVLLEPMEKFYVE